MKKVLSAILIIILAYSIIFATAVFAASNVAIQTNSDYTASKTTESKDFSTTVGSRIQLYVRLISSGEVGGNPIKGAYWESSNVQVVSMSSNGLITAQKEGTATITVTYDGGQDTIKVTVISGTAHDDLPSGSENPSTGGGTSGGGSSEEPTTGGETGSESGNESGSGSGESTGGTVVNEDGFTDLSNAKIEVSKEGNGSIVYLKVTGATFNPDSLYYAFISENNSKPTIDSDTIFNDGISLAYNKEEKYLKSIVSISKYLELKKDYYVAIVEQKKNEENTTSNWKNGLLVYGKKLIRPASPKYIDAISDLTHVTSTHDQVITTFIHDYNTSRKMQIKIGKITDISILKKIQNKDSSGFADLLNYAKSNSALYNKTVNCDDASAIEYTTTGTGNALIDLKGLEDEAYYYLYVKPDDENGKYYPEEGVTLAQADVFTSSNSWFLFFYGSGDFKWSDWGDSDGNGVLNGNLTKDPTTPDGKLPQTGVSEGVLAMIAATAIITGISFIVYSKNRDLR